MSALSQKRRHQNYPRILDYSAPGSHWEAPAVAQRQVQNKLSDWRDARGNSIALVTQQGTLDNEVKDVLTLTVRARLQRVGREMKMLVENSDDQAEADPALLRIVARAHDIQERLTQNSELTLHAIASQEHVTPGYVSRLLRLPSLAPDIITAIINGRNPPQLTAKKLMRLVLEIPVDWTAQRKLFGFHSR